MRTQAFRTVLLAAVQSLLPEIAQSFHRRRNGLYRTPQIVRVGHGERGQSARDRHTDAKQYGSGGAAELAHSAEQLMVMDEEGNAEMETYPVIDRLHCIQFCKPWDHNTTYSIIIQKHKYLKPAVNSVSTYFNSDP